MRSLHVNQNVMTIIILFDKAAVKSKLFTGLHESKLFVYYVDRLFYKLSKQYVCLRY